MYVFMIEVTGGVNCALGLLMQGKVHVGHKEQEVVKIMIETFAMGFLRTAAYF